MTYKSRLARTVTILTFVAGIVFHGSASSERLKDISSLNGVRSNQLIGYGLVVGLQNSGDKSYKSPFTIQTLLSMLERLGTTVDVRKLVDSRLGVSDVRQLRDVRVENVAAVMVTASLPPFASQGNRIDVTVSSLGDARSLKGGTLLLTPLKAANGEVYAVGQGPVSVGGGYNEKLRRASNQKSHPTVAKISGGATVEKEVGFDFSKVEKLTFSVHNPDFTTALRIVTAINAVLGEGMAKAVDSATIDVAIPAEFAERKVELVASIEALEVETDGTARVVMDERTGAIVIGEKVMISKVAISHGSITISIGGKSKQPDTLPSSESVVTPSTLLPVTEIGGKSDRVVLMDSGVSIGEIVKGLNTMGVSPRDLIAIFQILKSAGALQARLEII